jgi:D-inositol-3-phosphate glycosyltransferase
MRRVLEDDALRSRLGAGAVGQARLFSWERTAQRTLDVYRRARSSLLDAAS